MTYSIAKSTMKRLGECDDKSFRLLFHLVNWNSIPWRNLVREILQRILADMITYHIEVMEEVEWSYDVIGQEHLQIIQTNDPS